VVVRKTLRDEVEAQMSSRSAQSSCRSERSALRSARTSWARRRRSAADLRATATAAIPPATVVLWSSGRIVAEVIKRIIKIKIKQSKKSPAQEDTNN
jgi:hypothetical protein